MDEFALSEALRAIIVQEHEQEIELAAALDIDVPRPRETLEENCPKRGGPFALERTPRLNDASRWR
jgi:hypothetical protein